MNHRAQGQRRRRQAVQPRRRPAQGHRRRRVLGGVPAPGSPPRRPRAEHDRPGQDPLGRRRRRPQGARGRGGLHPRGRPQADPHRRPRLHQVRPLGRRLVARPAPRGPRSTTSASTSAWSSPTRSSAPSTPPASSGSPTSATPARTRHRPRTAQRPAAQEHDGGPAGAGSTATPRPPWPPPRSRLTTPTRPPSSTTTRSNPTPSRASWDGSKLTVYNASQHITGDKLHLAKTLGIPAADVRVIARFVGGGFGCKGLAWPHIALAGHGQQAPGQAGQAVAHPLAALHLQRLPFPHRPARRARGVRGTARSRPCSTPARR